DTEYIIAIDKLTFNAITFRNSNASSISYDNLLSDVGDKGCGFAPFRLPTYEWNKISKTRDIVVKTEEFGDALAGILLRHGLTELKQQHSDTFRIGSVAWAALPRFPDDSDSDWSLIETLVAHIAYGPKVSVNVCGN
ncbi:hypothetical protein PENTCL1PPCAC_30311, partial [Pristionchus entomophagus]